MHPASVYLPKYNESWALVIGINKYRWQGPLLHARSDAEAVAETLIDRFDFPTKNVTLLVDHEATRDAIMRAFLRYAESGEIQPDDRIVIFFAGHGHTITGRRGETGFLVPADGDGTKIASLIRWDELTRNADLIPAKHMLFLMDACYGGLALTRKTIPPGHMRFLKDMLQRYARQVLTAGKADEEVSDAGGTRPNHSIFTSYLLDGMEGAAASTDGIVTGHGLMAYTYNKVSNDAESHQTPHFGFIDGDGDFIFQTSALETLERESPAGTEPDVDLLIRAPAFPIPEMPHEETVSEILKRLLPSSNERIRLDDFISQLLRRASEALSLQNFPPNGELTNEEFATRLNRYEVAVSDLEIVVILLARWADGEQLKLLATVFVRVAELDKGLAGLNVWLKLNWYPILTLMYAAGISAISAGRYDSLRVVLMTLVHLDKLILGKDQAPIVLPTIEELTQIIDQFRRLPDMDKKYVPRSEYIFKRIQPVLEDQLLLARRYDSIFDEFEILLALSFADARFESPSEHVWGPPGRFVWKERGRFGNDPVYSNYVNAAKAEGEHWPPIQAGLFRHSARRFAEIADAYSIALSQVNWW